MDIRADIYSLGCTLYKLLSGRAPFSGSRYAGNVAKMAAHVQEPIPPICKLRPDVPEELVAVLEHMLAKDPAARYATPGLVADVMAEFAAGHVPGQFLIDAGLPASAVKVGPATDPVHGSATVGTHHGVLTPAAVPSAQNDRRWQPWQIIAAAALGVLTLAFALQMLTHSGGRNTVFVVPEGYAPEIKPDGTLGCKPMSTKAPAQTPASIPGVHRGHPCRADTAAR